jgi:hypothetical protein
MRPINYLAVDLFCVRNFGEKQLAGKFLINRLIPVLGDGMGFHPNVICEKSDPVCKTFFVFAVRCH